MSTGCVRELPAEPSVCGSGAELTVVIPARDAAGFLDETLGALRAAAPQTPVLVVDDASTDATAETARRFGAEVLTLPVRCGPAAARNAGARRVTTPLVLFLDADCVPAPGLAARVRAAFGAAPELVALSGSYDADPGERDYLSSYVNLRHHHTHQRAKREPASFWAGCGAVRREAFLAAGGFDAERYCEPQIEDIELGVRLRRQGRVRLDPALQVKHLKRWSLRSVVSTEVFQRALPWARLARESGQLPNDLNLRISERLAALLAPAVLLALPTAAWAIASGRPALLAVALLLVATSLWLHADLLRCFARARGVRFAAVGWLFHQIHLVYASVAFAGAWLLATSRAGRDGR